MIEHYFDNKHDIAIVSDGGFFCRACLVGKPTNKLSPDERYCTDCYDFLAKEAKLSTSRRSMDWKPVLSPQNGQGGGERVAKVSKHWHKNMSTSEGEKHMVDIIRPSVNKRGRKYIDLPQSLIKELSAQGMGSKAITTRLKAEGKRVSYKTIQRFLYRESKREVESG